MLFGALRHWVEVIYREATLSIVADYLQAGHPVIAFVDTVELTH